MKHRLLKLFIAFSAFLLSIFLGITALLTLPPVTGADEEFSALRAAGHIKMIAAAPHTAEDQAELKKIRLYLKEQLETLGFSVMFKAYDTVDREGIAREITNVYGTLPGTSGSAVPCFSAADAVSAGICR